MDLWMAHNEAWHLIKSWFTTISHHAGSTSYEQPQTSPRLITSHVCNISKAFSVHSVSCAAVTAPGPENCALAPRGPCARATECTATVTSTSSSTRSVCVRARGRWQKPEVEVTGRPGQENAFSGS
eukprot:2954846-Rhodomonas_salina.1